MMQIALGPTSLMAMKLLLIGDERKNRRMAAWGFDSGSYQVKTANSRFAVGEAIEAESFQAACIDLKMEEDDGVHIVEFLHGRLPRLPIVALVGPKERRLVTGLKQRGVSAALVTPFAIESLHAAVRTHALTVPLGFERGVRAEAPPPSARPKLQPPAASQWLTSDEAARQTLEVAMRAANSSAAILILGETGTGKTILAQTIHRHSPIRQQPFVTVNCPCLSHELLESDLFGHVRGAFTGAVQDTWGKVAAAEGGTLFLDEIGDLPMSLQPKLLRLLQEKQYERVGEATSRCAQVRIIAATNRDLKREVDAGRFREDLYYRLNVIAIDVPPLRSRPFQIIGTAEEFLDTVCRQLGRPAPGITDQARRLLESHAWPGNLRELRNVVERAAILSTGTVLEAADFPSLLTQPASTGFQIGGPISLHALETAHIRMVVASSSSLEEAARILQIDKSTLYRKRKAMDVGAGKLEAPPLECAVALSS
jgi:two-component system, NtrC family, response regulator AlgB